MQNAADPKKHKKPKIPNGTSFRFTKGVLHYFLQHALFFGGLEGIRTLDPHNANVVRSQLRYKPVYASIILPRMELVKGKGES